MVEISKKLKNDKGEVFIWLVIFIILFALSSMLIFDFGNLYLKTKKIKYAVNQSVKAATLSIHEGDFLAEGIFLIEPNGAKYNFFEVLSINLGLNHNLSVPSEQADPVREVEFSGQKGNIIDLLEMDTVFLELDNKSILLSPPVVKELQVLNIHPRLTTSYSSDIIEPPFAYPSSTIGVGQNIFYPSVVAVLQFEVKGVFLKRNITVAKMSSSQLISIYD